jgi:hypothetical protein
VTLEALRVVENRNDMHAAITIDPDSLCLTLIESPNRTSAACRIRPDNSERRREL